MGYCHYEGAGGAKKDLAESAKWYRKAAEAGLAKAQFNYGRMCQKGEGVTTDVIEAVKWMRASAEQGFANAQYYLAFAYWDGVGTTKNPVEAWKWLSLASAQNYEDAAKQLARMEARLKPEQIAEAKKLAAAFAPKKP